MDIIYKEEIPMTRYLRAVSFFFMIVSAIDESIFKEVRMASCRNWLLLLCLVSLVACQEHQEQTDEDSQPAIRAVKLFTVNEVASTSERKFPGTTMASTSSSLSFPASGKVTEILVSEGANVHKGQLLAKLDNTSVVMDKKIAEAERQQAQVLFEDKEGNYQRKKPLGDKGVITQRDLEESKAEMLSAKEQLNLTKTKVRLADEKITDMQLFAPFDGVISQRTSEPYVEVTAGQQILLLEGKGLIEIAIAVPESMLKQVELGQEAEVKLNAIHGSLTGTITEIAAAADVGNVFQVKVTVSDSTLSLYSGMSAEVILKLNIASEYSGYKIPLSCISPGSDNINYVYVFQPDTSTLKKTVINSVSNVIGNDIVVQGINAGDKLVSAGTSFVSDGLHVKPYQPAL